MQNEKGNLQRADLSEGTNIGRLWMEHLEALPCAAYVVQNDTNLTLLAGNKAFYCLFQTTEEEMQCRYGNRLSALLDAETLKNLEKQIQNKDLQQHMHALKFGIKQECGLSWVQTELIKGRGEAGEVLFCMSMDVTDYEKEHVLSCAYEQTMQLFAEQARLDYFDYEIATGTAQIHSFHTILPSTLADKKGYCTQFVARLLSENLVSCDDEKVLRKVFLALQNGDSKAVCELRIKSVGGVGIWARLTLVRRPQAGGGMALGIFEDITQQKEAARNYLGETQFYQAILTEKDAYAQVDVTENHITRIGGIWNLYNEIIDQVTYSQLIEQFINKVVHPEDRNHYLELMKPRNFLDSLDNGIDRLGCQFRRIVEQNKMMWMQINVHLFRDPLTQHVLALLYIKNIDTQKKQELMLQRGSHFDSLTNSYSRKMAERLIQDYLLGVLAEEVCSLVLLDMDYFKEIHAVQGNSVSNQILVRIADILGRTFRKSDIIGRLGGDKFILFIKNIQSREWMQERLEELYAVLCSEEDAEVLRCSMGAALTNDAGNYDQFLHQAEVALHMAKQQGGNRYVFYRLEDECDVPSWEEEEQENGVEETALDREEGGFDAFMGEQGDMAYLVDTQTFDLLCGNKSFYDRIGMTAQQCAGLKCYEVMHNRETPCPFCSPANWSTDKFYLWKNLNLVLEQEFLIKNKLVNWQGREVMLAIAVDISNDKSIVDSLDSGATEGHSLLSGVQRMADGADMASAIQSALEAIGAFFHASQVNFWQRELSCEKYRCIACWGAAEAKQLTEELGPTVRAWLDGRKWEHPVVMENPEAMLMESYELYHFMKVHQVQNQRWIQLRDGKTELGCISIDNISSNFQNVAFLESFSGFITSEVKKRKLIEDAQYANEHDELTKLFSRGSFESYMRHYHAEDHETVGVLLANLNNLKGINRTLGYQSGNYFICQFADMLREVFGISGVYRLNGDEFLVIQPNLSRKAMEERLLLLEQAVQQNGSFSVSVGYAWDDLEKDIVVLIDQATQAMRRNKKRHYDSTPQTVDTDRRKMLADLMEAMETRRYEVYLQPKVDLQNKNRMVGAEALIRYRDPVLGIVLPAQFIEVLEKGDLIRYIDLYVLEEVCRILEGWKKKGLPLPVVSLNFSRLTFLEKNILSTVEAIVSRYDVSKKNIEIEITESVANLGKSVLFQAAHDLYEAGFSISLDDFGTKYTNLSILADVDFGVLKVDRSLVWAVEKEKSHELILKNVINMCKDLGIEVVAEGVETKEQEQILRGMECQIGQGYLYGRPMPISEFEEVYFSH